MFKLTAANVWLESLYKKKYFVFMKKYFYNKKKFAIKNALEFYK